MHSESHRRDIDKAISNLMKYADNEPWLSRHRELYEQSLYRALENLQVSIEELSQTLDEGGLSHMLVGYLFEGLVTSHWDGENRTLVQDYLKRRGWREALSGQQYLRALSKSHVAIWEVVEVTPGKCVDLKAYDKPKSKTIRVSEQAATQSIRIHDYLIARIIRPGKTVTFTGAILPLPPDQISLFEEIRDNEIDNAVDLLLELREQNELGDVSNVKIRQMAHEEVEEQIEEIALSAWLIYVYHLLHQAPPSLYNRDGDCLMLSKVKYPVKAKSIKSIIKQLNTIPELDNSESSQEWVWLNCDRDKVPASGATVLGHIIANDDSIILQTNSKERVEKGQQLIQKKLKNMIGKPIVMLETPDLNPSSTLLPTNDGMPEINDPAVEQAMQQYLDNHYRQTLEETVPMLGNKTPRECTKTAAGRKKLATWLKTLEHHEAGKPDVKSHYDFGWLWDELGLKRDN